MEVFINTSLATHKKVVLNDTDIINLVGLLRRLAWEDNDFQHGGVPIPKDKD